VASRRKSSSDALPQRVPVEREGSHVDDVGPDRRVDSSGHARRRAATSRLKPSPGTILLGIAAQTSADPSAPAPTGPDVAVSPDEGGRRRVPRVSRARIRKCRPSAEGDRPCWFRRRWPSRGSGCRRAGSGRPVEDTPDRSSRSGTGSTRSSTKCPPARRRPASRHRGARTIASQETFQAPAGEGRAGRRASPSSFESRA